LLLNDAPLKCVVKEFVLFSVVACKTHLRCGWIFSDSVITHFLLILTVKRFENWSIFDEVIRYTKCANF